MHARPKMGEDKRWFSPTRDLANIWPGIIHSAIKALSACEKDPPCSIEEAKGISRDLGKLVMGIACDPVDIEQCEKRLDDLERDYPRASTWLQKRIFRIMFGAYLKWVTDLKPKKHGDAELRLYGLDTVVSAVAVGGAGAPNPVLFMKKLERQLTEAIGGSPSEDHPAYPALKTVQEYLQRAESCFGGLD